MKSSIFADITPCNLQKVNRRFGGTCRLHLQHVSGGDHSKLCLSPTFTLVSFLANSSTLKMEATRSSETSVYFQTNYMAIYPRL
jgi:hypothetical protein